ncbi:MAG: hypothetical protein D6770_03285 [Anaerolineae bacterium]|nr:MAG: hypothetical protein D6770_03285 [Anaerolineae bacterium]
MEALGLLLLLLFVLVTAIALLTALTLLVNEPVRSAQEHLQAAPGRVILVGLVNAIFAALIALVFLWGAGQVSPLANGLLAGILALIGLLVLAALAALTVLGLAALANLLGERMGYEAAPQSTLRGSLLLLLAALTPYVGWFIFAPLTLFASLGAAIRAVYPRR